MPVFAVLYHYDPAKADLRAEARPAHRAFLTSQYDTGTMLAGGAWDDDGSPGGLLIACGESVADVEATFDADPYRANGVLARREVRPWAQLFGPWAPSQPQ